MATLPDRLVTLPEDGDESVAFRARLRAWFEEAQRALPWREPPHRGDAYAVLVSEIMLQQTQVDTVIPYFEAWMDRWPRLEDLAGASEEQVLEAWQGLGFYHRARRLHAAARCIVDDHGGEVPSSSEALESLPGVGPYTSAAVRAFAFDDPVPAVDGNTARVWARLAGKPVDITKRSVKREAARALTPLVDGGDPGALAEAFIELGAMVCTPRGPACEACPVSAWCSARTLGRMHEIPAQRSMGEIPVRDVVALLVEDREGRVLFAKRQPDGLLGGLWGLPMIEQEEGEGFDAAAKRCIPGARVMLTDEGFGTVEHAFSHKRWRVRVHHARWVDGEPSGEGGVDAWAWRAWEKRGSLPSSTLDGKVFDAVSQASLTRHA